MGKPSTNTLEERRNAIRNADQLVRSKLAAYRRVAHRGINVERLAGAATWAITQQPDLALMPGESLVNSLMISSQIGLYPGPEGDCFLIPRWNGRAKRKECQWQVGYPGLLKLAWRSGKLASTDGEMVRETDEFSYRRGTRPFIDHTPAGDGTAEVTHYYFICHLNTQAPPLFRVWTKAQAVEFRDRFAPRRGTGDNATVVGPWASDFNAMALKSVCIQTLKFCPSGDQLSIAIKMDELADHGYTQPTVIDVSPGAADAAVEPQVADDAAPRTGGGEGAAALGTTTATENQAELCAAPLKGAPEGFGCGLDRGHEGECLP